MKYREITLSTSQKRETWNKVFDVILSTLVGSVHGKGYEFFFNYSAHDTLKNIKSPAASALRILLDVCHSDKYLRTMIWKDKT